MKKSLSERIGERARKTSSCTPHANRAIVLALRGDIQAALNDGWSVLAIYQTLNDEGKVNFSYQAFRRHVNRIFPGNTDTRHGRSNTISTSNKNTQNKSKKGFSFNANPDAEDLF
ncbi:MAG: TraK family protein [Candidatus Thiodiazotropha lotti]|nr:TraK family protein [Candidatus Thiodiazotropha lotti]MCW4219785.1 TraK family protein [Candidatus Thiodiazotropha lotti]